MDLSPQTRQLLLDAAWQIIRHRLAGQTPPPLPPDPALHQPAGCFVSLHRRQDHALRGCIGLLDAGRPLANSLSSAALAVLDDPRFVQDPVTQAELPELELEITVLGPLRRVPSPLEFEPATHGIYLNVAGRSGCFLPQVARETGWTKIQLLSRLCTEKLQLPPQAWQDPSAVMHVFSAEVLGPQPWSAPSQPAAAQP